jgi:hypothetical protein
MPKVTVPVAVGEPLLNTGGKAMIDPLLSLGNAVTGLVTCWLVATAMVPHPAAGQLKYTFCRPPPGAQALPQSVAHRPIPKIPFAFSVLMVLSAPPGVRLVHAAGAAEKFDGMMTCTGIDEAISPVTCTSASATGPHA